MVSSNSRQARTLLIGALLSACLAGCAGGPPRAGTVAPNGNAPAATFPLVAGFAGADQPPLTLSVGDTTRVQVCLRNAGSGPVTIYTGGRTFFLEAWRKLSLRAETREMKAGPDRGPWHVDTTWVQPNPHAAVTLALAERTLPAGNTFCQGGAGFPVAFAERGTYYLRAKVKLVNEPTRGREERRQQDFVIEGGAIPVSVE